jgi:hypothetical protein
MFKRAAFVLSPCLNGDNQHGKSSLVSLTQAAGYFSNIGLSVFVIDCWEQGE